jgi:pimeloyl-ACP methyl ester carboxylesterase
MAVHGAQDWRPAFRAAHPLVPEWFTSTSEDLGARLPSLRMPSLLLWGDADPISPVGVGQRLASLLPESRLIVLSGGSHDVAMEKAEQVAPLIDHHLTSPP